VAAEAKDAGLLAGDIIVAVNFVSVVGFDRRSVYELGFNIPAGPEVAWTIERGDVRRTLHARAPGALQAPLYLQ